MRTFFIQHRAKTPYFPRVAEEFISFLMAREGANDDPGYMLPLAHYEWLELYLFTHESELPTSSVNTDDFHHKTVQLTPLATPVAYEFPVHQIQPGWVEQQQASFLLVFRDASDGVRFFELKPLAFELLHAMQSEPINVVNWLTDKAKALNQPELNFIKLGLDLIEQFNKEKLIYVVDS